MFKDQLSLFKKWHDVTGDLSLSETCRVGSGRPRRRLFGVDEGVENTSLPLLKRGRTVLSDCATFSGFTGIDNEGYIEKQNHKNDTSLHYSWSRGRLDFCFLVAMHGSNKLSILWITHFNFLLFGWDDLKPMRYCQAIFFSSISLVVLIFNLSFIVNACKTTEGRTIWRDGSSTFQ